MPSASRAGRALRLLASSALLLAICACGAKREEAAADRVAVPEELPPLPAAPVLPDSVMPLTEGGDVSPHEPGTATVIAAFPDGDFATLKARVQAWLPAHGWTLVEGSETDSERTATALDEMGMGAAAALARQSPSFGASYQQAGSTVVVTLMNTDGALTMHIDWY